MTRISSQRETDDRLWRGRSGICLAHDKESDLMNTLPTIGKGAPRGARLEVGEWFVDAPFTVEVRARHGASDPSTLEMIRYVKLALGIFNNRSPGSFARLHRNRRTCRLDG
jgi:hypothetical protein